jgi:prepilin-type processing-associated H-X9-DG protein
MAYTLNEALCGRGIYQLHFRGNSFLYYHFVPAARVHNSAGVILATELWGTQATETTLPLTGSQPFVSNSRRPVSGIAAYGSFNADQAYQAPNTNFTWATIGDLCNDPQAQLSPTLQLLNTTLDLVGRNHGGSKKLGPVAGDNQHQQWDLRTSNFLYLDGHVETKHITQTVYPTNQWTYNNEFYSLGS